MNAQLPEIVIEGVAFWASRLPGWEVARAVIRGEQAAPEAPAPRPAPALLASDRAPPRTGYGRCRTRSRRARLRSRGTIAQRTAVRVRLDAWRSGDQRLHVRDARDHAGADLADQVPQLRAQRRRRLLEHRHSEPCAVHGAQRGPSHVRRRPAGSAVQVACEQRPVLFVAFDIEARGALSTMAPSRGLLGVALVLAPVAAARPSAASI